MHIIVRYELESGLIDGSIKVKAGSLQDETLILLAASPQGCEYSFLLPANASALVSRCFNHRSLSFGQVEDLPKLWKEKMQAYLGVVPPNDAQVGKAFRGPCK